MKGGNSHFRKYHNSMILMTLTVITVIVAAIPSLTINPMSTTTMIIQVLAQPSVDNKTSTAISENMSATPVLGNPIFVEHDKITSQKQVDINGTKGLSVTFSGNGTVRGISFTDIGNALITFRPNGFGDLKGQAVITTTASSNETSEQEHATYTFYATGHQDTTGTVKSNGATFIHTNPTTGKLASSIDNLVIVFRNQVDKMGNDITIGWELK